MSCPSPLQVNQIHSSTGRHQGPQGSRDLWILRYFKSCSYCSVHLHTKVRVSTPLCVLRFLFCWTSCEVLCISVDNMLTAILLFPQECGYSAFLSKAFLLWKSDLKKTGLFELLLFDMCSSSSQNKNVFLFIRHNARDAYLKCLLKLWSVCERGSVFLRSSFVEIKSNFLLKDKMSV